MATVTTEVMGSGPETAPWKENLNARMICPDCKEVPPNLISEDYSTVCGSCGMVLADREIDLGSEWRTFANDDGKNDDPSRVGEAENPLLNGNQLETSIAFGVGGARSRELHRAQNRIAGNKGDKNLKQAYGEIAALCDSFGIQKIVSETSKYLFKQAQDSGQFKGKSQDVIIAGCIFIACRQCQVPRTFREIFSLTKVNKKDIGRIFKSLERFFNASSAEHLKAVEAQGGIVNHEVERYNTTTSTPPWVLAPRYCNLLGLPFVCESISAQLARKMGDVGIVAGRSPLSIASACIYFASHLMGVGKSAKEIAAVTGVSDGTIRTSYKHLYAAKEKVLDPSWLAEGKGDVKNLPSS